MEIVRKKSPNFDVRRVVLTDDVAPSMIVLHYTGTKNAAEADAIYMMQEKVAPHYMVDTDGTVTQYVDEASRAWHAGHSGWAGDTDINSASIGIEVVNHGHDGHLPGFPDGQISALIGLIRDIRARHTIPDWRILGHSDVAPGRKIDPGEAFPWRALHAAGIGLMPRDGLLSGEIDTKIELFSALREWGYDYTDDFDVMIREFRRHYLADTFGVKIPDQVLYAAVYSLLEQKKIDTALPLTA